MVQLALGLALFLGAHSIPIVGSGFRRQVIDRIGEPAWMALFSLCSAGGVILIALGYGAARTAPIWLYQPPVQLRYLAAALVLPVFPLLLATYLPGRISRTVKHPMLTATKLWATAHLLANGGLHDLLLFGSFLAWAVLDRISLRRREDTHRALPERPLNDWVAVAVGLVLYFAFWYRLHALLIGMPLVLPR